MSDIFHEVDEDVRRDKAAELWRRYQTPILILAVLIVAATGAWSYYQTNRQKAAEAANARFEAAVALANDGKGQEAADAFDALAKDGPKGYATLARIRAAELREDKARALAELNAIAEDKNVDKLNQEVAMLRAALINPREQRPPENGARARAADDVERRIPLLGAGMEWPRRARQQ